MAVYSLTPGEVFFFERLGCHKTAGGVVEVDLVGFVDDGGEEVGEVAPVGEDAGGVLAKGDYVA